MPQVYNVKIHFTLKEDLIECVKLSSLRKRFSNYYTIRFPGDRIAYTIFPKSKFVNITGIPNFAAIPHAVKRFNEDFQCNVTKEDVIIDNSTATGQFDLSVFAEDAIPLRQIKYVFERDTHQEDCSSVTLCPKYFPAAVFRRFTSGKKQPTVVLFSSGKFNILGARGAGEVLDTYRWICAVIHKHMTILL